MTMQIGDTLLWQGVEHSLPGGGPLLEAWPEKDRPELAGMGTFCWRGFIAKWLVDDDGWLRVASVRTGKGTIRKQSDGGLLLTLGDGESLFSLFPSHEGPVAATWFTGVLETGHGKPVRQRPYEVVYPHYRIFHVEAGKVVRIEDHGSDWKEKQASEPWTGED